jgi:glycosyltransferase involved in cell wall biosynthesis
MKVIHTTEQIDYAWGGLTYSVPRLCLELQSAGHEPYLAVLSDLPEPVPFAFVRRFVRSRVPGNRQMGASPGMLDWMLRQVRTGTVTAMHVHGMWRMPNVYPCRVGRRFEIPVVFAPRGSLGPAAFLGGSKFKRIFWTAMQKPAMRQATCFHATAQSEADEIRSHGFTQPIAIIPNGIDIPAVLPKVDKTPRTAICLGRIHPKKAIDVLLKAWKRVEQENDSWHLRIVGPDDGGHLPGLRALASELGLQRVRFEGPLDGEDRLRAYAQASLFVMPTWNENFGLTVAESLAARTPALVSKGAPWSALDGERCGWWIDCGVESFEAGLMRAIACSDDELAAMGERGRAWIAEEFGWKAVASQAEVLYEWLVEGQPEPRRPTWVIPGSDR